MHLPGNLGLTGKSRGIFLDGNHPAVWNLSFSLNTGTFLATNFYFSLNLMQEDRKGFKGRSLQRNAFKLLGKTESDRG